MGSKNCTGVREVLAVHGDNTDRTMEDNPCCQSMIQTSLIVFNCLAFLASGGVLGFSIYALSSDSFSISMLPSGLPDSLGDILFDHKGNTFQLPVIILAIISAAVLLVSFLGCVGSCQQSRCLVSMYFLFLSSFLVMLVAGTAYCFLGDPEIQIAESMKASMTRYKGDNVTEILWDKMQSKLGCCGVLSIDDWQNITWTEEPACSAPGSCKITDIVESGNATAIDATNSTSVAEECLANLSTPHHSEGCLPKLREAMHKYINIIGAIMVSVWAIVIINVLFSFALCVVLDYAEYTYK